MKKYLFGVVAIVLAVIFSSFKKQSFIMYYDGPETSIQQNLQDPTKWTAIDPSRFDNCGTGEEVVCTIELTDDDLLDGDQFQSTGVVISASGDDQVTSVTYFSSERLDVSHPADLP